MSVSRLIETLESRRAAKLFELFPSGSLERLGQIQALLNYVQASDYEGYDLFDGLNSPFWKATIFYNSRYFRLALIQFCKKFPVNIRPLLGVQPGFNPKGGALFLMGLLRLWQRTGEMFYHQQAELLYQRLCRVRIDRSVGDAWGYNFDWQARAFFVPEGTPNLVTSVFVGRALLAYYNCFQEAQALELALGVSDFIGHEMIQVETENWLCFRYIPGEEAQVHNANLLAASYLAETLQFCPLQRQNILRHQIQKAVRFSTADIHPDGAWPYGTLPFHRWVDHFHTGFNIESLLTIQECLQTQEYDPILLLVLDYYLQHLFTAGGLPKYYAHRLYPLDVHVLAEALVVLERLRHIDYPHFQQRRAGVEQQVLQLVNAFQDPDGFFYYQKGPLGWNRIPYIRWGQAWMFYALTLGV